MRNFNAEQNRREHRPTTKGWLFLRRLKTSRRKYRQHNEAAAIRLYNPYRTKTSTRQFKIKGSILPIIFLSWICLLIYLPYFRINKISYSGLEIIKQAEIDEIVESQLAPRSIVWPVNNYFIFDENSLAELIKNKFSVNEVVISKIFPNSLSISLQEKISAAIYDSGEAYYLLDKDGNNIKYLRSVGPLEFIYSATTTSSVTFPATSSAKISSATHIPDYRGIMKEFGEFPIIYDSGLIKDGETEHPFDDKTMLGIMTFFNSFQQSKSLKLSYFIADRAEAGITAITDKSYRIKFQPAADIDGQITRLRLFLKSGRPNEYVDLRYGDRIFWK